MPDSDMTTESLSRPQVSQSGQSVTGLATQLNQCEQLVDELLKANPDDTIVTSLMAALGISSSSLAVERIGKVFEKLEFLLKNHKTEKDAHDLPKYS